MFYKLKNRENEFSEKIHSVPSIVAIDVEQNKRTILYIVSAVLPIR